MVRKGNFSVLKKLGRIVLTKKIDPKSIEVSTAKLSLILNNSDFLCT